MQAPKFSFKLLYQWKKDLASKSQIILSGSYSVKSGRSTHFEFSENAHVPPHCLQHISKCTDLFCDRAPEPQKNSSSNSTLHFWGSQGSLPLVPLVLWQDWQLKDSTCPEPVQAQDRSFCPMPNRKQDFGKLGTDRGQLEDFIVKNSSILGCLHQYM